jgi:hypothetical protein
MQSIDAIEFISIKGLKITGNKNGLSTFKPVYEQICDFKTIYRVS